MSRQVCTTVYKFSELSDKAKERALDVFRNYNVDDSFWYECIIDDAKHMGSLMGIDVTNILFAGFWNQGDGACFEGSYRYKKGSVKAIMDEAPIDTELHAIVRDLQGIQELNFYRLSAYVEPRGYYCHENCTVIDVETIDGKTVSSDAKDSIKECLRDFMRWIYRQLEREFEYLTSAGAVQEMIEANEYEFTEDGERY